MIKKKKEKGDFRPPLLFITTCCRTSKPTAAKAQVRYAIPSGQAVKYLYQAFDKSEPDRVLYGNPGGQFCRRITGDRNIFQG